MGDSEKVLRTVTIDAMEEGLPISFRKRDCILELQIGRLEQRGRYVDVVCDVTICDRPAFRSSAFPKAATPAECCRILARALRAAAEELDVRASTFSPAPGQIAERSTRSRNGRPAAGGKRGPGRPRKAEASESTPRQRRPGRPRKAEPVVATRDDFQEVERIVAGAGTRRPANNVYDPLTGKAR